MRKSNVFFAQSQFVRHSYRNCFARSFIVFLFVNSTFLFFPLFTNKKKKTSPPDVKKCDALLPRDIELAEETKHI